MPTTLFLSTHPGDALFGAGALLASLPAGETFHASVYAPVNSSEWTAARFTHTFVREKAAFDNLGIQAIEGCMVDPPNTVGDQVLKAKLAALLATVRPDAVILPLGVAVRDGDLQLAALCMQLRSSWPQTRWLQYYDQPFIGFHRGRYPELAFARRVRLLAEVDEDASMFNWKPAGAPGPRDPLAKKIEACLSLGDEELAARFFTPRDESFPPDPALVRERVERVIGQREWLCNL